MVTVQIRMTEQQLKFIDRLARKGIYEGRCSAVRDAARRYITKRA